ncbi:GTPase Der [Trichinella pseudospiralis]
MGEMAVDLPIELNNELSMRVKFAKCQGRLFSTTAARGGFSPWKIVDMHLHWVCEQFRVDTPRSVYKMLENMTQFQGNIGFLLFNDNDDDLAFAFAKYCSNLDGQKMCNLNKENPF